VYGPAILHMQINYNLGNLCQGSWSHKILTTDPILQR